MTTKDEITESVEIIEPEQEDIFITGLNDKITTMVEDALGLIGEDRKRAEETFQEMRDLVLNGDTDPDTLRELNKAQENISSTADQVIKVLAQIAKVRSGDTRIQIAQINEAKKTLGGSRVTGKDILKALDEMEQELNTEEEKSD